MTTVADAGLADPFDTDDYDPIEHLNALFAETSTLAAASKVSIALQSHQDDLDRNIRRRLVQQRTSDAASVQRIQTTQSELRDLFANISSVQQRAEETQRTISDMTADIKRLDATKRNLTLSMTALKRLQMLSSAYEQLRILKSSRQYRECSGLLAAVMQLMAHFKSYRSIEQIATLSKGVADVQREMLEQICEDFEVAFAKGEVHAKRTMLNQACDVVDTLGDYARQRLVTWYCNTELREYRQVFRGSEEAGSLDNIGRRYSWFMRLLKTYDAEHALLFPAHWAVNERLANTFCEGTRDDFKEILQKSMRRSDGQPPDVTLLLSALQETLDFEHGLEKRFAAGASASRGSTDTTASSRDSEKEKTHGFTQAISEAFEPYLSVWVESQERQLDNLLSQYRQQPIRNAEEDFHVQMVMSSSTELFNSYRLSLAQCAKLTTGARLLEMCKIFAKNLDVYSQQMLLSRINDRGPGATSQSIEDIIVLLNTADYCHQTTGQLEDRIRSRIDNEFKDQVDLQAQADSFMGVASAAIRALVRKVEIDCEAAWREMRYIKWSDMDSVGDESGYMRSLVQRMQTRSAEIAKLIHKGQYTRAFCDNTVDSTITTFASNIVAVRPISETGAEQLLLDSYSLKKALSGLLTAEKKNVDGAVQPNAAYLKRLNALMTTKVDPLLKTLQVQAQPPEGLVQAYLIHIHDSSEANFRKILELKGIRARQETASLVELFNAHRVSPGRKADLRPSNPILGAINLSVTANAEGNTAGMRTGLGLGMAIGRSSLSREPSTYSSASRQDSSPVIPPNGFGSNDSLSVQKTSSTLGAGGRFDAAAFGSAIFNAARDGVDRLGTPALAGAAGLSNLSSRAATPPPPATAAAAGAVGSGLAGSNSMSNLANSTSGAVTGSGQANVAGGTNGTVNTTGQAIAGGLNENLKNFGKFFRRDGASFGTFGRQG